ncbi:MAG: radical SAM protein [Pirellulales bacterium]|nr:radical SAM protein [Pirellulales bacterium]
MKPSSEHLEARPASFREDRDGRSLFVWGDLGQWLVVDAEAAALLDRFEQRQNIKTVLRRWAERTGKPLARVRDETLPVLNTLVERGILGDPPPPAQPPDDPLRLSNLTFNITNRCNLRCPWCYNPRAETAEVPVCELLNWIAAGRDTIDAEATFILLGGEPFLDESRLIECLRGARNLFESELLVSTNGTKCDDATLRALVETETTVQISLDAATAARHDAMRGQGVFDRAMSTARRLVGAGVHTVFSMVMTRDARDQMEAYFDLAERLGVQEVRFIPLRRIGQGRDHASETVDLYAWFGQLVALLKRRPDWSRFLARDFFSILMTACRFSRLRTNCGIGRRCLFVDADGRIFPCPNHRDAQFACGTVTDTPLAGLLAKTPILATLRDRYQTEQMTACRTCPFRYWCAGDCRAEVLSLSGDPTGPSPYCRDLKRLIPMMFWLIADGWTALGDRPRTLEPWS